MNAFPVKRPQKTPIQRVQEFNEDVLDLQTDDLRDLIEANRSSRGQLLKQLTLKPESSTDVQTIQQPDDIPVNNLPNTRHIIRSVVKA